MKMIRKNDRTQVVVKVIIAFLLVALLTVYNSLSYNILNTVRWKHLKLAIPNTSDDRTPAPPEGYLVWSDNCHMSAMEHYSVDYLVNKSLTLGYVVDIVPNCTEIEPFISKSYNETLQLYVLHINLDLKEAYLNGTDTAEVYCCYTTIYRDGDKGYAWNSCSKFGQDYPVPKDVDYMIIECSETVNSTVFYQDGISFVQKRADVDAKLLNNTQSPRPFGILMFGIDSLSQFNFRRVMPETFDYVQNTGWFELSGYNKMDDNTFPNLMAIFSGLDLDKADELCHYHEPGGIDNCTTLFNLFNRQGLVTAYSEDTCEMSTFDYLKPGFINAPTDYYQRPLLLAIEEKLPIKQLAGLSYCIGPRRYGEYVYDFGVEFAERYLGHSIFGLFWTNSFSHNDWLDPTTMDERMVEYFNYMDSKDILDNNVVILFSDHGSRWGFLRHEKDGYIEERLPMFFMRLPQWFQDAHPGMVQSLILNKNRLTSPYDVHVTLKQLAMMSLGRDEPIELPISCPTCQTLLVPVLENRTCSLAGIADHWCTCTPFEVLDRDSESMVNLTNLVIDEMNTYLNQSVYADKCVPLTFKRNAEANLKLNLHEDVHTSTTQEYRMNFETDPNEASFDATFLYHTANKSITIEVTEISRLNRYAEDSACIDDNIVKKYCICEDSIKKNR